jgi:hypothetical protein
VIPPPGDYRYEIVSGGEIAGVEEDRLTAERLSGVRISGPNSARFEAQAQLGADGAVLTIALRYARGPFTRSATYQADGDLLRGSVDALAGRNATESKLGRFREIDGDLILFKALIIARARIRGQSRFTGRIASINPNTLVPSSRKETYRQRDVSGLRWVLEPLLGESEEIEIDQAGRIVRRIDRRGVETVLREFKPPG